VEELLRTRLTDPLRSFELESRLWLEWKTHNLNLMTFERWQASQLTDAQLYELKQYYLLALDRLKIIGQVSPEGLQEFVKVDRESVVETLHEIDAEIDTRTRERGPFVIAVFAPGDHGAGSPEPADPPKPGGPPRGPEDQPRKPKGPGVDDLADVAFEYHCVEVRGRPDETGSARGGAPRKPTASGPSYVLDDMNRDDLLHSERIAVGDPGADREFRVFCWERLRLYKSLIGPDSEVERRLAELSLIGFEEQIQELEESRGKLSSFEKSYRDYGGKPGTIASYGGAAERIDRGLIRIQNSLDGLVTGSGGSAKKIRTLQERIKRNLGANPPPTTERGDAYNDPFRVQALTYLDEQFRDLSTVECQAKSAYFAHERRMAEEKAAERAALAERAAEERRRVEEAEKAVRDERIAGQRRMERQEAGRLRQLADEGESTSYTRWNSRAGKLEELRLTYPNARPTAQICKLGRIVNIYYLGPQHSVGIGRKNYMDEDGVRYEYQRNGIRSAFCSLGDD
jgi:hypothetical protein